MSRTTWGQKWRGQLARVGGWLRTVRRGMWERRRAVMRGAAIVGFVLIVLLIHRSTYSLLVEQPQFRFKPVTQVHVAPSWAGEDSFVDMPVEASLLDDGMVTRLAKAFENNPWVKRVTNVERRFPDRVRVRLDIRQPHVAVRRQNGIYLLDEAGVLLPGVYASAPNCVRRIEMVGVLSPLGVPGQRWTAADVVAGMELVELASTTPALQALGIKAVDVANVGGRIDRRVSETAFVTASGCLIYWGRAPGTPGYGELSPTEKLELLVNVLDRYPRLAGLRYVKVHAGARAVLSPSTGEETRLGRNTRR